MMKRAPVLHRTHRHLARLIAAAMMTAVAVPVAAQVSLATVVDMAERNSTAVRIAAADVRKARAALSESKDVFFPSLQFGTGIPAFPEEGFTGSPPTLWSTTVQSLVFSVPQNHYIQAARAGLQAASANLKDAREQVALDASSAYIELDAVNREMDAAQKQQEFAARLVTIEEERAEAGVDPLSNLLQAKLTAANIKLNRLHLETRRDVLIEQISALTGLAANAVIPQHDSIPAIPQIRADEPKPTPAGIEAARLEMQAKLSLAKGDQDVNYFPQLNFFAQYNRNTTLLNDVNSFFARPLPANNLSSGFSIQVPLFDMGHRAKARESAADALRAKVEAEQAERQNDIQIAQLTGTIRELDTMAEIASLKQQIAQEQLKTVLTEMEVGNGSGSGPGSTPQPSPKAEQLARIDESQKLEESLDSSFDLAKARLSLLRALGHMGDWLNELNVK